MAYQPPFTITTEILNLVAQISQQVGELNACSGQQKPDKPTGDFYYFWFAIWLAANCCFSFTIGGRPLLCL